MARITDAGYDAWAVRIGTVQLTNEDQRAVEEDPASAFKRLAGRSGKPVNGVLIDVNEQSGPSAERFSEWHVESTANFSKTVYIKEV
jgi:hypothetical protein